MSLLPSYLFIGAGNRVGFAVLLPVANTLDPSSVTLDSNPVGSGLYAVPDALQVTQTQHNVMKIPPNTGDGYVAHVYLLPEGSVDWDGTAHMLEFDIGGAGGSRHTWPIQLRDLRTQDLRLAFFGDVPVTFQPAPGHDNTIFFEQMAAHPDLFDAGVFVGDLAYQFTEGTNMLTILTRMADVFRSKPLFVTVGNHETYWGSTSNPQPNGWPTDACALSYYFRMFRGALQFGASGVTSTAVSAPNLTDATSMLNATQQYPGALQSFYGANSAVTIGPVLLVNLNSCILGGNANVISPTDENGPQVDTVLDDLMAWLTQVLEARQALRTPFVAVFDHRPLWTEGASATVDSARGEKLRQVLNNFGVQFFMSGHEHGYRRGGTGTYLPHTTQFVTAAGGRNMNDDLSAAANTIITKDDVLGYGFGVMQFIEVREDNASGAGYFTRWNYYHTSLVADDTARLDWRGGDNLVDNACWQLGGANGSLAELTDCAGVPAQGQGTEFARGTSTDTSTDSSTDTVTSNASKEHTWALWQISVFVLLAAGSIVTASVLLLGTFSALVPLQKDVFIGLCVLLGICVLALVLVAILPERV